MKLQDGKIKKFKKEEKNMATIIVEYKHDKNPEGGKIRPLWADDGGFWYNPDNYTYVGMVNDPEVKIPNTVIKFTKTTFVERQLGIHKKYPFKREMTEKERKENKKEDVLLSELSVEMNDAEVKAEAEEWWDKHADS